MRITWQEKHMTIFLNSIHYFPVSILLESKFLSIRAAKMCMKQTCKTCREPFPFSDWSTSESSTAFLKTTNLISTNTFTFIYLSRSNISTDKTTWWGCGRHISSIMDFVPQSDWCTCNPRRTFNGKEYPPKNGEGKASRTGDYGSTGVGNVAKLTGQGAKPDTF